MYCILLVSLKSEINILLIYIPKVCKKIDIYTVGMKMIAQYTWQRGARVSPTGMVWTTGRFSADPGRNVNFNPLTKHNTTARKPSLMSFCAAISHSPAPHMMWANQAGPEPSRRMPSWGQNLTMSVESVSLETKLTFDRNIEQYCTHYSEAELTDLESV